MAYNYAAAYGTSYGQYSAQNSTLNTQQQTSSAAYPYPQTAATAYGVAASATTTSTPSVGTQGYGTTAPATTTAAGAYNYAYNYNYTAGTGTNYNAATPQTNSLQAFQQSWYGNSSTPTTPATQQTGTTAPTATAQQRAYGQYLQQYQQQMSAYQQYANAGNVAASTTTGKTDNQSQQQKTGWGVYNQMQQQRTPQPVQSSNATDPTKTGWGNYPQQKMGIQQPQTNQQKSTGIVFRTPMKYSADTQQYSGTNASQNYNQNQSFKSPSQANTGQSSYTSSNPNYNQNFVGGNQSYGNNQSMAGNNMQPRQSPQQPQQQQQQQQHQQYNQRNQNNPSNFGQNQGFQQNQGGQNMGGGNFNMQNRGGFTGTPGNMNMRGSQQHGGIRPLMSQRSPMGGGNNTGGGSGGFGNMGPPRDGPSIPPFPRAWHGQDQSGPRNFKDPKERWGGPGPRGPSGFNPNQQQQNRTMYNNNARNPKSSNRELWSPAQKSGPRPLLSNEMKPPLLKKEEAEKVDKDKHPEIKSFLYAWLGARRSRPAYDIRQLGERPNIMFRCDLRVDKYSFVGVGKATSKKEAQSMAAWKFAEYLVKIGEIQQSDLPSKQQSGMISDEMEGDIGDVNEQNDVIMNNAPRRMKKEGDDFRNRSRERKGRGGGSGLMNRGRGARRGNPPSNWAGPLMGPDMPTDIQPLMAVPVAPWGSPPPAPLVPPMGGPPPRLMGPAHPPPLMDYGPPFWEEGWVRPPMGMGPLPMGPPMPMRPPFMRRNQNDFWRRRDIEERMMDLSRGGPPDWAHPEDMFISQMIRNQQEGERRQRGQRGGAAMEAASAPGEWERVQQQARPIVTSDDRHVMAKHSEIYPQEGELKHLHRVVNTVEQALKLLSDKFVDEDHPKEAKKTDSEEKKQEEETKEKDESTEKKTEEEETGKEKSEEKTEETKAEPEKEDKESKKEEKRAKIKILKRPKRTPKQVDTRPRVLCGVNRVGPLAKGLLITKDDHVELVLLCGGIPTVKLLDRIMQHIEGKLEEVDSELKLVVERKEEEAGFLVMTQDDEAVVKVSVMLTAMSLRKAPEKKAAKTVDDEKSTEETGGNKEENARDMGENAVDEGEKAGDEGEKAGDEGEKASDEGEKAGDEGEKAGDKGDSAGDKGKEAVEKMEDTVEEPPTEPDPVGILPKPKMLEALAGLRHTHWFQAKACMLQSCVILTRILRDMQRRHEDWGVINEWALEVLIYNCLSSSEEQMSPGDACRRFFEVLAGGILLPDMPGFNDPCERNPQRDILDCLTVQQRENLTRKAQSYLRNLAFREIHVVLGMDKLPSKEHQSQKANAKGHDEEKQVPEEKEKIVEPNNQRKRRFEANGSDGAAESPKRSLTDEEDTDTQQNMAELSISDENSDAKLATVDTDEAVVEEKLSPNKEPETAMDISDAVPELTKEEEDALLEDDDKMDT